MVMSILASWRRYRQWGHAKAEAKQLVGETKRILKKKRYRIPESVSATLGAAVTEVEEARKAGDLERLRQANSDLDGKMDEHVAFARKSATRQYAESIGLALGVALLLRAFVVEAFQIPTGSMIPTLEVGDHIFVSKFAYAVGIPFTNVKIAELGKPKRGDIIVFKYPPDQSMDFIKRVVGLPGETIELRHNELFIDGRPMPREFQSQPCTSKDGDAEVDEMIRPCEVWMEHLDGKTHLTHQFTNRTDASDFSPRKIPEGHYFAMGDNRDNSRDSRVWGYVPYELIKGRALIVWWSRDPSRGGLSPAGIADWFKSIHWHRFFERVE
jgi:signal peptidase I